MFKNKLHIFLIGFAIAVFVIDIAYYLSGNNNIYPSKNIYGYIAWGAGGATDNASRFITPLAENYLNSNIILQNKTGATGAIATQFVENQKPDGYSILYHAENPALYKVMDISSIDYDMFKPIILIGQEIAVMISNPNSNYKNIEDVIEYGKQNPSEIKLGTTGVGGLPFNVASMINTTSGVVFNQVPFDGDASLLASLLGNHIDVAIVNLSSAIELFNAGEIHIIASIDNSYINKLPDVKPITEVYSEYDKYFPWGAFYGVFVHKDTPDDVTNILTEAFINAFNEPVFSQYLDNSNILPMGLTGDLAKEYIDKWQQVSSWLLHDAGETKISPEVFGIERIE